jgi:phosphatidylserine/phosphatidylglycerophosphate/cardiolipin synthase-like enzyme
VTKDAREQKELRKALQDKEKDIATLQQQLRQSKVEFLRTEQHRGKLFQAVREAKQEIMIISPWMTPAACDENLCKLFAEAIVRGVRLRIGYHMGKDRYPGEAERNRHNVETVKRTMRKHVNRMAPSHSSDFLNDVVKTAGTHQKILVCDREFAITGSFNWLSYAGNQDAGYHQELSVLFQHPDPVNELAEIVLQV